MNDDNSLTSAVPSELGKLTALTKFWIHNNMLCDNLPTEVQALSSIVPSYLVYTGNNIGTPCPTPMPTIEPTISMAPTSLKLPDVVLVHEGHECGTDYSNLGTDFGNAEDCALHASRTTGCGNSVSTP